MLLIIDILRMNKCELKKNASYLRMLDYGIEIPVVGACVLSNQ